MLPSELDVKVVRLENGFTVRFGRYQEVRTYYAPTPAAVSELIATRVATLHEPQGAPPSDD